MGGGGGGGAAEFVSLCPSLPVQFDLVSSGAPQN